MAPQGRWSARRLGCHARGGRDGRHHRHRGRAGRRSGSRAPVARPQLPHRRGRRSRRSRPRDARRRHGRADHGKRHRRGGDGAARAPLAAQGAGRRRKWNFGRHRRCDPLGGRSRRACAQPVSGRRGPLGSDGGCRRVRALPRMRGGLRRGERRRPGGVVSSRVSGGAGRQLGRPERASRSLLLVRPRGTDRRSGRGQVLGRAGWRAAGDRRSRLRRGRVPLVPGHQHGRAARRWSRGAAPVGRGDQPGGGGAAPGRERASARCLREC